MNSEPSSPSAGYALFDVVYQDRIQTPRSLIVEIGPKYHTVLTEGEGMGHAKPEHFMTLDEWLEWLEKFRDELTGKDFREAQEHARAPLTWSRVWNEFKARYDATGNAFLD